MSLRRAGVIADHGSLIAYRTFVIEGRDAVGYRIAKSAIEAVTDMDHARVADRRLELADWTADLAWVEAELAKEADAPAGETLGN